MGGFYQVLFLSQFQILYSLYFLLLSIYQPLVCLHSSYSPYLLISFDSLFLKFLYRFLQLHSYSFIAFCQLYYSGQSVFSFYSEFTKVVVKNVELRIIRDIRAGYLELIFLVLVHRNKTTGLSLCLHLLKYLNKSFELVL